jgi:hypothetical protein
MEYHSSSFILSSSWWSGLIDLREYFGAETSGIKKSCFRENLNHGKPEWQPTNSLHPFWTDDYLSRPSRRRSSFWNLHLLIVSADDVLDSLSCTIAQLLGELSELRNEQRILRTQIDEFHKVVLSDEV